MKANQKSLLANDTRAQVGIGTMIVFIATILVAATAAAVLIDTSGKLQERSSSTGNEATKQVASNLVLKQVYGNRDDGAGNTLDDIQDLHILVSLAPGASSVDLEQLRIGLIEGSQSANLEMEATNDCTTGTPDPADDFFCTTVLRDPKGTYTQAGGPWVLSAGGLVEIQIPLDLADDANGMEISPRTAVSALLRPEVGSPLIADFITPTSYGEDDIVMLR